MSPFDLHVLGTPPAFILSQDQTLMFKLGTSYNWLFFFSAISITDLLLIKVFIKGFRSFERVL